MLTQVTGGIEGKTIKGVFLGSGRNSPRVMVFTDENFLYLTAIVDYEGDADIDITKTFDPLSFGDANLLEAGIMTQDEIDTMRSDYKAREKSLYEAREREEFERLKVKFGK